MSDATIPIGSELHKELFCRTLLATHDPYDPAEIPWPQLDAPALARLRSLPFWDLAVATEAQAAACIAALTRTERDPLLREAIALQGFEESRHQRLLEAMLQHYSIPLGKRPDCRAIPDPEWAFLRLGYTECFDSFFAFGLFRLASKAGFFPDELVTVFEPVMQEEARHILFFANWAAYRQARQAWWKRPAFIVRRAVAFALQAYARLRMGRTARSKRFTYTGQDAMAMSIKPQAFLKICLSENSRRLEKYDSRLLRPKTVPGLVRLALSLWPGGRLTT